MTIFLIVLHVIICFCLICLVLIQRGRGSGLVESFQGVESMFGTKTNVFLTKMTTVLSVLFFFTCLSLALLSFRQSRSLLKNVKPATQVAPQAIPANVAPQQEAAPVAQPQQSTQTPAAK